MRNYIGNKRQFSMRDIRVMQIGNLVDDTHLRFKNPQRGRVYLAQGIAPAIYTCGGGNTECKIVEFMENEKQYLNLPPELEGKKFRIRKLTPRECFRLMDVDDADIDKIQAAGISNSAQYKLAGNSIVVNVLFHLFRKMFVETEPDTSGEPTQLGLF